MAAKRKKWQVRYRTGLDDHAKNFPSQATTYGWIRTDLLRSYGATFEPTATIWVDEGDGRGWQQYDEVDLVKQAAMAASARDSGAVTSTFRSLADTIAYVLGEPPQRVDWALAIVYDDGEVRYIDMLDEDEARTQAAAESLQLLVDGPVGHSGAVRAFPASQEVRVLPDETQIIGPWTEGK